MSKLVKSSDADPEEIFEINAKLGEGSYGAVFKALDKRDGTTVAIKVLQVENEDAADLQKEINILKVGLSFAALTFLLGRKTAITAFSKSFR